MTYCWKRNQQTRDELREIVKKKKKREKTVGRDVWPRPANGSRKIKKTRFFTNSSISGLLVFSKLRLMKKKKRSAQTALEMENEYRVNNSSLARCKDTSIFKDEIKN